MYVFHTMLSGRDNSRSDRWRWVDFICILYQQGEPISLVNGVIGTQYDVGSFKRYRNTNES